MALSPAISSKVTHPATYTFATPLAKVRATGRLRHGFAAAKRHTTAYQTE